MNNKQKNNIIPISIIGAVLAALIGGWWFYSNSTPSTTVKMNANKSSADAVEAYSKASPGANPPNILGAPNAIVTVEEFADFQCPTCAAMYPKVQELRAAYGNRIRIIFREYPLPMHTKAYDAACAAEAAGMQGKFWDMENQLFPNQQIWANEADHRKIFKECAQKIGLNVDKFSDDMIGLEAKLRVDADIQRGRSLNTNMPTPSFYINGRLITDLSIDRMRNMIDAELQKAEALQSNTQTPAS